MATAVHDQGVNSFRVAIVDDNPIVQKILIKILEKNLHITVQEEDLFTNGLAVLEALGKRHYDLILMDIDMPILDGYETVLRIRGGNSVASLDSEKLKSSKKRVSIKKDEKRERERERSREREWGKTRSLDRPVRVRTAGSPDRSLDTPGRGSVSPRTASPDRASSRTASPDRAFSRRISQSKHDILPQINTDSTPQPKFTLSKSTSPASPSPKPPTTPRPLTGSKTSEAIIRAMKFELSEDAELEISDDDEQDIVQADQDEEEKPTIEEQIRHMSSRVKTTNRSVPIVCITSHAMYEQRLKYLNVGMDEVLTKPFNPATVTSIVTRFMRATSPQASPSSPTGPPQRPRELSITSALLALVDQVDRSSPTRLHATEKYVDANHVDSNKMRDSDSPVCLPIMSERAPIARELPPLKVGGRRESTTLVGDERRESVVGEGRRRGSLWGSDEERVESGLAVRPVTGIGRRASRDGTESGTSLRDSTVRSQTLSRKSDPDDLNRTDFAQQRKSSTLPRKPSISKPSTDPEDCSPRADTLPRKLASGSRTGSEERYGSGDGEEWSATESSKSGKSRKGSVKASAMSLIQKLVK